MDTPTGCYIPNDQRQYFVDRISTVHSFSNGSEQIEPRSGNANLDRALAQSLGMLSRTFDVLPGFAYYRDDDRPNARALSEPLLQRTDGTVLFGLGLLRMLLQRPQNPDASVVAVCAHEYGHIVSYKNGMISQLDPTRTNPFRAEQFADYVAGFFAGVRKRRNPTFPAVAFATTQRSFGGSTRGSHGTGVERGEAVERGFLDAYQRQLSPDQGIQAGFAWTMARA
ncbi:MAG TPA: hypothetical protein VEX35_06465 [Allosphingosinicella sp.]|nr:hypothetical protein [Allosphingosinicella sp.]